MVQALFSHYSKAHSWCSAPVRHAQMLQPRRCHIFQQPLFFPLSFSLFRTLCLFWEHSRLLHSCTFSSPSPAPPLQTPHPLWEREATAPSLTTWWLPGQRGPWWPWLWPRNTHRHCGGGVEESPPPWPNPSNPPSSPPSQMMKTLSVWITKVRCVSAEGLTVIKAVPLHLCLSIPLSTYSTFVTSNQFWDFKPFHVVVTLPNWALISLFFFFFFFYEEF